MQRIVRLAACGPCDAPGAPTELPPDAAGRERGRFRLLVLPSGAPGNRPASSSRSRRAATPRRGEPFPGRTEALRTPGVQPAPCVLRTQGAATSEMPCGLWRPSSRYLQQAARLLRPRPGGCCSRRRRSPPTDRRCLERPSPAASPLIRRSRPRCPTSRSVPADRAERFDEPPPRVRTMDLRVADVVEISLASKRSLGCDEIVSAIQVATSPGDGRSARKMRPHDDTRRSRNRPSRRRRRCWPGTSPGRGCSRKGRSGEHGASSHADAPGSSAKRRPTDTAS